MSEDMRRFILEKLNWRYAVKKFDPTKKISDTDWKAIEESLRLSPSSYGLQPWKFFVVTDVGVKQKLRAASWNQSQVTDCSHFVILAYKEKMDIPHIDKYIKKMADVRGLTVESLEKVKASAVKDLITGPRQETIEHWAEKQTYIVMGMSIATAAYMSIDACPMEGIDPKEYNKILGLEGSGWTTGTAIAFGYRHPEDRFAAFKKVRFDHDDVFTKIF